MTVSWARSLAAYVAWLIAHALAGLVFVAVAVLIPAGDWWVIVVHGLAAGVIFGLAQWLVLRWFFPGIIWWLPATVVASPISWYLGIPFAAATLFYGGWLAGGISAIAQMSVLAIYFGNDTRKVTVSVFWLPAAIVGGAIFYFSYLFSVFNPGRYSYPPLQSILIGSVGFAAVTGLVVAMLAGLASLTRAEPSSAAARS